MHVHVKHTPHLPQSHPNYFHIYTHTHMHTHTSLNTHIHNLWQPRTFKHTRPPAYFSTHTIHATHPLSNSLPRESVQLPLEARLRLTMIAQGLGLGAHGCLWFSQGKQTRTEDDQGPREPPERIERHADDHAPCLQLSDLTVFGGYPSPTPSQEIGTWFLEAFAHCPVPLAAPFPSFAATLSNGSPKHLTNWKIEVGGPMCVCLCLVGCGRRGRESLVKRASI